MSAIIFIVFAVIYSVWYGLPLLVSKYSGFYKFTVDNMFLIVGITATIIITWAIHDPVANLWKQTGLKFSKTKKATA